VLFIKNSFWLRVRRYNIEKAKSSISVSTDNEWDCGYNTAMAEMYEFIKQLPSADVQSVKHGRCVIDNEGYERCSVCNEHENGMRYFTLCPRCGARLEGDIE
jgi:hypothetical protein